MDTELFELCKEVYKRTGWELEDGILVDYRFGGTYKNDFMNKKLSVWKKQLEEYKEAYKVSDAKASEQFAFAPLYTSDYLLEKLPKTRMDSDYNGNWNMGIQWHSEEKGWNYFVGAFNGYGDTPLKALLKLSIALDNAKELNK